MEILPWDGEALSAPGAYSGIPLSTYHGRLMVEGEDSASKSFLWKMAEKSAAHAYLSHYSNPDRDTTTTTEAMLLGRGAHHLILGEADFSKHFVFEPETYPDGAIYPSMIGTEKKWHNGAKWCKAWAAEQRSHNLEILRDAHMDIIRGMAHGLAANALVRAGALEGDIEVTLVAQDPKTGIWLKVRPDAIPTSDGSYADLKTAHDITDDGLEKAIGDTGIFLQGAMIRRVCRLLNLPFESFSPVFVEKTPPHIARVKTLTDADLDTGETLLDATLALYRRCLDRGAWLGPGGDQTDAQYCQMSPFKRRDIEHRITQMQKELSL